MKLQAFFFTWAVFLVSSEIPEDIYVGARLNKSRKVLVRVGEICIRCRSYVQEREEDGGVNGDPAGGDSNQQHRTQAKHTREGGRDDG